VYNSFSGRLGGIPEGLLILRYEKSVSIYKKLWLANKYIWNDKDVSLNSIDAEEKGGPELKLKSLWGVTSIYSNLISCSKSASMSNPMGPFWRPSSMTPTLKFKWYWEEEEKTTLKFEKIWDSWLTESGLEIAMDWHAWAAKWAMATSKKTQRDLCA